MSSLAKDTKATMIPAIRYRDAAAAIDWLCEAFGFERHLVVPGEGGAIDHAQLVFGNGMVMLGSARDDEFGALQQPLAEPGGPVSLSIYIVVSDVDAHHARAALPRAPRSSWPPKTRTTAAGSIAAATRKAISGTSAATTPGRRSGLPPGNRTLDAGAWWMCPPTPSPSGRGPG